MYLKENIKIMFPFHIAPIDTHSLRQCLLEALGRFGRRRSVETSANLHREVLPPALLLDASVDLREAVAQRLVRDGRRQSAAARIVGEVADVARSSWELPRGA